MVATCVRGDRGEDRLQCRFEEAFDCVVSQRLGALAKTL